MTTKFSFRVVSPTNLCDNGYTTDKTNYLFSSPYSRWVFDTQATQMLLKVWGNIYGGFSGLYASAGLIINGAYYATLECVNTNMNVFTVTLPAGQKRIEIVSGLISGVGTDGIGVFPVSVYFSGAAGTLQVDPTAPANRMLVYGESIAVGGNATYPPKEAWPVIVRQSIPVAVEAAGVRSLNDDASTAEIRAAFVAQLASFAPAKIWIAMGTNDYGLEKWSAADFGTAYAAVLDDLHTALPAAVIYAQTPLLRAIETELHEGYGTLGDYRTAIANAQATRSAFCVLVDGTAILELTDLSVDVLHPATAGHAKYAAAVKVILGL